MPQRLDQILVQRGLAPTRSRARDAILRGCVRVDGVVATKAGAEVGATAEIAVADAALPYVSRGALKLAAALDHFGLSPAGRIAVDVGASTGGFTEVLLAAGAAKVYAVDVGRGQLAPRLAGHSRVVALEATDARALDRCLVAEPVTAIAADVSFISLTLALPAVLTLAAPGAWLVALVKPQFELGPAAVGKGGIVRDPAGGAAAVARIEHWLAAQPGWRLLGAMPAPIAGKAGNQEHLIAAARHG